MNEHAIVPMARHFRGSGHIVRFIEYMDVGAHERLADGRRRARAPRSSRAIDARVAARAGRPELPRRSRAALALPRRRRRDRRHRVGDAGVLPRLHARAPVDRRQALHVPVRRPRLRPARAAARRRDRRRDRATRSRAIWRQRADRYSEIRTANTPRESQGRDVATSADERMRVPRPLPSAAHQRRAPGDVRRRRAVDEHGAVRDDADRRRASADALRRQAARSSR